MRTTTASVVMLVVITISNGDDVATDSERGNDGVVTISNGDDVDADRERGDHAGDHY